MTRGSRLVSTFLVAVAFSVCLRADDFPLVANGRAADIVISSDDFKVVAIAADDLAADVERVAGVQPSVRIDARENPGPVVLIGTLGKSPAIAALVAAGKLDVDALRGQWETFLITIVDDPLPGAAQGLVIVGSDRRGTAFGVYELSQEIGVSPWYWWADVPPKRKDAILIPAGTRKFGPPSVQYRGIFINDEDWGLQLWAAKTFAPAEGGIGPQVYRKVFELLLRLKANTLWPAMHACTKPFNAFPENAALADDYAIVMGSSHAEPMLRNNVGEWTAPHEEYDYVHHRDEVLKYWDERVAANGRYENIYTIGMRGIHDSNMVGPRTDAERIATLEKIFTDQRALIARHVQPDVTRVPQIFCAYKEVLDLYRQGLQAPDDVTIVWPDDNFGYVRNFAAPEEQRARPGGFGVYYHISYLGRPLAHLWLSTTPPALIWEEMSKAYDYGAHRIWIANVGDIKPAEIDMEFFLQMAWDIDRWKRDTVPDFLGEWATREFGSEHAPEIARIMAEYYRLNYQRKPEHLQWWLPREEARRSPFQWANDDSVDHQRYDDFLELERLCAELSTVLLRERPELGDAFTELVGYPVINSARAFARFRYGEIGEATLAQQQQSLIESSTVAFNEHLADGKWNHIISAEPADGQWSSMRIAPWHMPDYPPLPKPAIADGTPGPSLPSGFEGFYERSGIVSLEAEHFSREVSREDVGWRVIPGLGRTGEGSMAIFPTTAMSFDEAKLVDEAPRLEYDTYFTTPGVHMLTANLIPTRPIAADRGLRFAVGLDEQPPQLVVVQSTVGDAVWSQSVLNATITGAAKLTVTNAGNHVLKIYGVDPGVLLDKIVINCDPSASSGPDGRGGGYLGPTETKSPSKKSP